MIERNKKSSGNKKRNVAHDTFWKELGFSSEDHMMKTAEMLGTIQTFVSDGRFKLLDNRVDDGQAYIQYEYDGAEYVIVLKMCSGKELGGKWLYSKSGGPPKI